MATSPPEPTAVEEAISRERLPAAREATPRPAGPDEARLLDLETEARAAFEACTDLAAARHVSRELAIEPKLGLHVAPRAFRETLLLLLRHAIDATPGGKVLLGALRQHNQIQLVVVDDGPGADAVRQRANLRRVEEMAALAGGVLEINSMPGQGTTILLRLPGG